MPEIKNDKVKKSSKRLEEAMDELIIVFDNMMKSFKKNFKPQENDE